MSIIREHLKYYREIFNIKNLIREPILMIGLPTIDGGLMPGDFNYADLKELFRSKKITDVKTLDLFDPKADYRLDLNLPIPKTLHNKFNLVVDIGTIEHVFDTAQVIKNYTKLVELKGYLLLITCVNGYFDHGLHIFNPEMIMDVLKINGFEIIYNKYISNTGAEITDPSINRDILIFLVTKKKRNVNFVVPQQTYWKEIYAKSGRELNKKLNLCSKIAIYCKDIKRYLISKIPINIRTKLYSK